MVGSSSLHCFQPDVTVLGKASLTLKGPCHIGRGTVIQAGGGVELGHNVVFSFDCILWSINHDYEGECLPFSHARVKRPIVIGDNVWVGRNAIIAPGSQVGEGAIIGIGAVVMGKIPPLAVVSGNPAKVVRFRSVNRYLRLRSNNETLWKDATSCPVCDGSKFHFSEKSTPPEWHSVWRILPKSLRLFLQMCIIRFRLRNTNNE
ncbi:acyltransferase [Enterovibrio calviensis]|uniref:acyltransferase n=1 Tax=Enterovibrio calviensis TaxID=91359 RepID=UPI0006864CC8|nr:acyltransferase [Enterovibrio calviensis]